ncbi:hypothetical protein PMAYCL1PPCAC_05069, partial [Pristionchus mayeri]
VKIWIREALSGLECIHSLGVFHRDLNPDSMCISKANEQLTLLGFSKARKVEGSSAATVKVGNVFYMAIEMQVEMKRAYDEKVDIWSLAVVLCEMLTGTKLFTWRNDGKEVKKQMIEYCEPVDDEVIQMVQMLNPSNISGESNKSKRVPDFCMLLKEMMGSNRSITLQDIDNEPKLLDFIDRTLQQKSRARLVNLIEICEVF